MSADLFTITNYAVADDAKTVTFSYELIHNDSTHQFSETLIFPVALLESPTLNRALRALHVALSISYYKIFIPPVIRHPYKMEADEALFWNDVFHNGLGEFLYVNKLSKDRLAHFSAQDGTDYPTTETISLKEKALLGIGGGKDSVVAGELLKKLQIDTAGFVMATGEQLGQAKAVADVMQVPLHAIKRTLDPNLMNLQTEPGAYRGHVPISLIFGLVGTVVALTQQASYVIVANESSASTPTTTWQGEAVNHQWSKSYGFEQSLQQYIHKNITPELTYFSAIRPLSSVAVAKKFAQFPHYFEVFTSDNYVFRINPAERPNTRWSMESPKTLSSYILLAPWLTDQEMLGTFGNNYLNQPQLESLFLELTGIQGHPPLDCVGTVEELVLSLNLLAQQKRYSSNFLMKLAVQNNIIQSHDWDKILEKHLQLDLAQAFPAKLEDELLKELAQ